MTNTESQNQIEYVLSKCILSPGDGFILDRMTVPKLNDSTKIDNT